MSLRASASTLLQTQESYEGFKLTSFSPTRVTLKRLQVGRRYPSSTSSALTVLGESSVRHFFLNSRTQTQENRWAWSASLWSFYICFSYIAQSAVFKVTCSDSMPQFRATLGFLSYVSLLPSAPHLIPLTSSKRFTIHPLVFCSWICCAISPLHFHKVFTEISKPRHGNGRKKERKSNIEHSLGAECVFFSDPLLFTLRIFCS